MQRRWWLMVTVGLLLAGYGWAAKEKFLWVEPDRANVRAEPRRGAKVIATVGFGQRLLAVDKVGDFYRIDIGNSTFGYIHQGVVTDEAPGHLWVKVDAATVRQAPRQGAGAVATLERATMLESDGIRDDWYHVRWGDGQEGWIHEGEVDDDPPETLFVITDTVVLHAAPTPSAEVIASLPLGAQLAALGEAGPFAKVRTAAGEVGFVYRKAVSDDRPEWLFVKVSSTPVMVQPAMDAEVLRELPSGSEALAFAEERDFYLVLLEDGQVGWIHEDYVIPMGKR